MGRFYPLSQLALFGLYTLGACLPGSITAAVHVKQLAEPFHCVALFQSLDYRKLLNSFDIKRAVAFFRISFSISSRRIRFSSSWIFRWSGVIADAVGVLP